MVGRGGAWLVVVVVRGGGGAGAINPKPSKPKALNQEKQWPKPKCQCPCANVAGGIFSIHIYTQTLPKASSYVPNPKS